MGENPVRDTAVAPNAKEPQQTHAYSLDEIRAILAVLPEPAATIFATAAFTGYAGERFVGCAGKTIGMGKFTSLSQYGRGTQPNRKPFRAEGLCRSFARWQECWNHIVYGAGAPHRVRSSLPATVSRSA